MTRQLMTIAELSAESGFPEATLYRFLAPTGDLPCIRTRTGGTAKRRTSGRIRVRRDDWEAWLERHRSAPSEPERKASRTPGLKLPGADRYVQ